MKITIPKPCHEDWNQMSPEDKGRFCLSCQKTVVDFTKMDKSEIQQYFQTAVNEKVCGRIKAADLAQDNILPEVHVYPNRFFVAPNHTSSHLFLLTVGLVFLYSCNTSPEHLEQELPLITQESDVQDIDSHDISIGDTIVLPENKADSLGEIIDESPRTVDVKNKSNKKPICSTTESREIQYVGLIIQEPEIHEYDGTLLGEPAIVYPDVEPEYPGGESAMLKFIKDNLRYDPNTMIAGKVYVRFTVGKDGSISNPEILRGVSPENDKEVLRVISKMPKWIPGSYQGNSAGTTMVIPVVFKLI